MRASMLTPVSAKKIDHLRRIWFAPHELLHELFGLVVPQIVQHSDYVQADAGENFLDLVDRRSLLSGHTCTPAFAQNRPGETLGRGQVGEVRALDPLVLPPRLGPYLTGMG